MCAMSFDDYKVENMRKCEALRKYLITESKGFVAVSERNSYFVESKITERAECVYEVLSDKHAKDRCLQYIRENIWEFDTLFLYKHLSRRILNAQKDPQMTMVAIKMLKVLGADSNAFLLALIDDMSRLLEEMIQVRGRGPLVAGVYGSEEIKLDDGFYAYKIRESINP